MGRNVLGVVAGLAGWAVVASIAGLIMRLSWPAYASVASAMTFTLPMMIARLSIGALATLSMGPDVPPVARAVDVPGRGPANTLV